MFFDIVLLTRDEGFINFDGAGFHDAVKHDLITETKDGDVAWLDFF